MKYKLFVRYTFFCFIIQWINCLQGPVTHTELSLTKYKNSTHTWYISLSIDVDDLHILLIESPMLLFLSNQICSPFLALCDLNVLYNFWFFLLLYLSKDYGQIINKWKANSVCLSVGSCHWVCNVLRVGISPNYRALVLMSIRNSSGALRQQQQWGRATMRFLKSWLKLGHLSQLVRKLCWRQAVMDMLGLRSCLCLQI